MLSDVAGFAVSLFAAWAVTRKSHKSYSFGYHRIEILGALASVLTIWAVTGALVYEAVLRVMYPEPVNGKREQGGGGFGFGVKARLPGPAGTGRW